MKPNKKSKLDLGFDFLGGLGPLTKEEEKMVSDFIKAGRQKAARKKQLTINKHNKKRA